MDAVFQCYPGPDYQAEAFYSKYSGITKLFDPNFFSKTLGKSLSDTFIKMMGIIAGSVVFLLFFFFLEWHLTLIALIPVIFALICTLGTLKLLGHPLGLPGLMLSIVIMGMGIDYSLFFVRSYQRYFEDEHPSAGLIRMSVFMASVSTIIGFGVLSLADHALLKSAGLTSLLGITYALAGAFLILPPLLKRLFARVHLPVTENKPIRSRVMRRYQYMEAYPRVFAQFKMICDPMFLELPHFFNSPRIILDIGTGYGVPSAWLVECFPQVYIYGIEPNPERVRIASRVLGQRGVIRQGHAPDIPDMPGRADAAIMIDMIHYLSTEEVSLSLEKIYQRLREGGKLVLRATIPSEKKVPWLRWLENMRLKMFRIPCYYRSIQEIQTLISQAGFTRTLTKPSGSDREEVWLIAEKKSGIMA